MSFTLGASVLLLCSTFGLVYGVHSNTRFTATPPVNVNVAVNDSVTFVWKFKFGNRQDWTELNEFVWGTVDSGHVTNKYITVTKGILSLFINQRLPKNLRGRISYSGTIRSTGCRLEFTLTDVQRSDGNVVYGCDADIAGVDIVSQPFRLTVT